MQYKPNELDVEKCVEMISDCACLNLRKASRAVTRIFDEALQQTGLRSTQLPVLVTLTVSGPTSVSNLADELVMDRTSLGRLLVPLASGGFIGIRPGKDRRTREVSLTTHGYEAVRGAIPLWEKAQAHVVAKLGERRWRYLHGNLTAVASLARAG